MSKDEVLVQLRGLPKTVEMLTEWREWQRRYFQAERREALQLLSLAQRRLSSKTRQSRSRRSAAEAQARRYVS